MSRALAIVQDQRRRVRTYSPVGHVSTEGANRIRDPDVLPQDLLIRAVVVAGEHDPWGGVAVRPRSLHQEVDRLGLVAREGGVVDEG